MRVSRGEIWLSPEVSKDVAIAQAEGVRAPAGSFDLLTPRQREMLPLIAEGLSTQAIARRLDLSVEKVKTCCAELMEKLGIHGVAGLVRYAIRAGIVQPGS